MEFQVGKLYEVNKNNLCKLRKMGIIDKKLLTIRVMICYTDSVGAMMQSLRQHIFCGNSDVISA